MPSAATDDELRATLDAIASFPTKVEAAASLGISTRALRNREISAASRGLSGFAPVMPGMRVSQVSTTMDGDGNVERQSIQQKPEHGEQFALPAGHRVKGVSALLNANGEKIVEWIKTTEGQVTLETAVETIKSAFSEYEGRAEPVPAPVAPSADLLTLIPCNDWHVRLLTWSRETGENWDLKIAERVIGGGIEDAIARSPCSDVAIVLGGGDLLHADTDQNRTEKSGNVLDADGRHQKGIEVAQRLKVRTIDAALRNNKHVIVRILKGNHDEYSSVAIAYFLLAWYRNEPRVTVDVDASLYFWHRFGNVLLGATHGHSVKLKDMAQIMAHRRAEDWGRTKFRYIHGFHIHHKSQFVTEGGGVVSESHQAPIPQDAWHFGAGFLSGRSLQTITYHRDFGEVSRVRVAMLDAGVAA